MSALIVIIVLEAIFLLLYAKGIVTPNNAEAVLFFIVVAAILIRAIYKNGAKKTFGDIAIIIIVTLVFYVIGMILGVVIR